MILSGSFSIIFFEKIKEKILHFSGAVRKDIDFFRLKIMFYDFNATHITGISKK
jgi:hypothetical protein